MSECCGTRMTGVEIRGVYDGVLYYQCMECGKARHRFSDQDDPRLYNKAIPYVNARNGDVPKGEG